MIYRSPDKLPPTFENASVFIAGGISNCPDWQTDVVSMIDSTKWDVVNPRRVGGFDIAGDTAEEQITWEHYALSRVHTCLFWFPKETLCPITLLECGRMVEKLKHSSQLSVISIGWHPEYPRAFDLQIQLQLESRFISRYSLKYYGPGWDTFCENVKSIWG